MDRKDQMKNGNALLRTVEVQRWLKKYARWRFLAVVSLFIIALWSFSSFYPSPQKKDYIAQLIIKDEIQDMEQVRKAYKLLEDKSMKGLIILANSPGGSPAVSEAWYGLFDKIQKKDIPVVAITGDVCASGCYLAIAGVKKIYSYNSSLVGSIGAVMSYPNIYNLLKKAELDYYVVKSGPLKAEPNMYSQTQPEYTEETQKLVTGVGTWFVDRVVTARKLQDSTRDIISKGSIFTAGKALELQLIDAIGDELDVIEYMRAELKNPLPVHLVALEDQHFLQDIFEKIGLKAALRTYPSLSLSR